MNTKIIQSSNFNTEVEHFIRLFDIPRENQSLEHVSNILKKFSLFPYENLSKILLLNHNFDNPIFRHPGNIIDDFQNFRLGGTCFALTYFLKKIMNYFSYDTDFLLADMKSGDNTHTALRLNYQKGQYLLDPGYLIQNPLRIDKLSVVQDAVFVVPESEPNRFTLYTFKSGNKIWRYSFLNEAVTDNEYFKYWNKSFHWMTMHGICLSRKNEEGFLYLHNNYLKQESKQENFKGKFQEDISIVINKYFNIPKSLVQKAQEALTENLHYDKELGFEVPKWVK